MKTKRKSGQVLILVLLVVVVSLAIGLSVASRNLSNLKISSQTEQSQRAYSLAESSVEKILGNFNNIGSYVAGSTSSMVTDSAHPQDSGISAVVAKNVYERQIPVGEVGQVDLSTSSANTYNIMWAKTSNDPFKMNECKQPASLEVTLVYQDSSSNYAQRRWYLQGATGTGRIETFAAGIDSSGDPNSFNYSPATSTASGCASSNNTTTIGAPSCPELFVNCAQIKTGSLVAYSPAISSRKILRIRPIWADTTVNVSGLGASLGVQEYEITSTSKVGNGVTRKLLVKKSALPSVPAVFDFAVYSETDITK